MKKLPIILLCIFALITFTACNPADSAPAQNKIMPAPLSQEQQEIIDLFSIPSSQEPMIFDFNTEETYHGFEVWVEVYQNGEIIDRPASVSFHNDTAKNLNGKVAVIIRKDGSSYQWTLSVVEDGARYSHDGTAKLNIDPSDYGRAFGPMNNPVEIKAEKEIVIYSSTFAEDATPLRTYDEQTLQAQPELLKKYPAAFLIKCVFTQN